MEKSKNIINHGKRFTKVALQSFVGLWILNITIETTQQIKLGNITNAIVGLIIFIAFLNIEYDFIGVRALEK